MTPIDSVLATVLATLTILASLRWPMVAVCMFLAVTFSNTAAILVHVHDLPSIGTLIVPALGGLLLVRTLAGFEDPSPALTLIPFALGYFVLATLGAVWSRDFSAALADGSELAKNFVIMLVLVGFLTTRQRRRWALWTVALTVGSLSALSLIQIATRQFDNNFLGFANASLLHIAGEAHDWRLSGPLPDPNFFAQLLVLTLPLPLGLALTSRSAALRVLAAGLGIMILATIALTYSRGALLALGVLGFTAGAATRQWGALALVMAVLLGIAALYVPEGFIERLQSGIEAGRSLIGEGDFGSDPAVVQRISVMRAAILMFLDAPLFGVGPGQFSDAYPDYALAQDLEVGAPAAAHSLYLEILAEHGLLGLAVFAAFVGGASLMTVGAARLRAAEGVFQEVALARAMLLGLTGYLAAAVFLHDAFPRFFWSYMALMIAFWAGDVAPHRNRSHLGRSKNMQHGERGSWSSIWTGRRSVLPILLAGLIVGGTAYVYSAREPETYTVEAKLLYRFGREYYPITPTEVRRNWGENIILTLDNALTTEMHLLQSHEVCAATVRAVGNIVTPIAQAVGAERGSGELVAVRALKEMMSLRRVQGAAMLSIRFSNSDPDTLPALLDAHLAAYRAQRRALFHTDRTAYFDAQTEALEADRSAVQAELAALRERYRKAEEEAAVTEWSPDRPVEEIGAATQKAQALFAQLAEQIAFLEARSEAVEARLIEMEGERAAWRASFAYTEEVAPSVEVADRTPVMPQDDGAAAVMRAVAAGLASAVIVWLLYLLPGRPGAAAAPADEARMRAGRSPARDS